MRSMRNSSGAQCPNPHEPRPDNAVWLGVQLELACRAFPCWPFHGMTNGVCRWLPRPAAAGAGHCQDAGGGVTALVLGVVQRLFQSLRHA